MHDDYFGAEEGTRDGLGPALVRRQWRDGDVVSLHVGRDSKALWLVWTHEDDEGEDWSAAPAGDEVAAGIVGDTLAVGAIANANVSSVHVEFGGRLQQVVPDDGGAWLSVFEHIHLPNWLVVREMDAEGQVAHEFVLPFEDCDQHEGLLRRATQRLHLALHLPGAAGLPRGSTTYPSHSRLRWRPFRRR